MRIWDILTWKNIRSTVATFHLLWNNFCVAFSVHKIVFYVVLIYNSTSKRFLNTYLPKMREDNSFKYCSSVNHTHKNASKFQLSGSIILIYFPFVSFNCLEVLVQHFDIEDISFQLKFRTMSVQKYLKILNIQLN